jgi:hypothetical protein
MATIQDSIQFNLTAEEVVVNNTVKVTAHVTALMTQDQTEAGLRDNINTMMQRFIKADWQFANMTRSRQRTGVEEVNLTATARVPESENYNLDGRARDVSREGLQLHSLSTDTQPTIQQIEEAQSKLRRILLVKAGKEQDAINTTLQANYRLGEVVFDPPYDENPRVARAAFSAANYGSGFAAEPPGGGAPGPIGNAVKLGMAARVTLRIKR